MHLVGLVMTRFLLHNIRYDMKEWKPVVCLTIPGLSMGPMISDILMDTEFSLLCLSFMNINLLGIRKIVSGSRSFLMQFVSGLLK